jgi:prepilin-type N-terminal cleavage/methylation domain-containing protein/prepilin-type processing-associated H-X9-DG protein
MIRHSHCKTRQGFTLLELLVVISIVTVMISLLSPALNESRARAKAMTCQSSLRQARIACSNYELDNRDWLPPAGYFRNYPIFSDNSKTIPGGNTGNVSVEFTPMEMLLRQGYVGKYGSIRCPENPWSIAINRVYGDGGENYSYSLNVFGRVNYDSGVWNWGTENQASPKQRKKPIMDKAPWTMILYADGHTTLAALTGSVPASEVGRMKIFPYWLLAAGVGARGLSITDHSSLTPLDLNVNGFWHDGPNAVMADGHVQAGQARRNFLSPVTSVAQQENYPFPVIYSRATSGTYSGGITYASP